MSTEAIIGAVVELFYPELLCDASCLKLQILYVILRDVLQLAGTPVDRHCWVCIL